MRMTAGRRLTVVAATAAAAAGAASAIATSASAAAITDTPFNPPALMNNCHNGPLITEPQQLVMTCADANNYFTDLRWGIWSANHAIGFGTDHINRCLPNCAASNTYADLPSFIYLDNPVPVPGTNHTRFSHARVLNTDGVTDYQP